MKRYLFTPGPTPVPPEVLAAMAAPVVHHRSPDFRPVYERCLTRLREVCRTESDVLLFTSSGTGAFESAVVNLVSPGEPHLVVSAGSFGERWIAMTKAYGADVDELRYAWGETPDPDDVRARLAERQAEAVWVVQSETSTGVVADVQAIAAAAKEAGSLVAALDVALGLLLEEGLDAAFERHVRLGRAARAGAKAMGLELFSPDEDRSAVVTAVNSPDAAEVISGVRDRFGITLAGGQGDLKGKIFRIGHIGWFDVFDITTALAAIELVLAELGADIERGVAVTAALEAYEHSSVA